MTLPRIICLMGPTASGKTALAVSLAEQLPLDIVSVDSAMVYRDMDIGTSKPDASILKIAPHRLISFVDPATPFSAGDFYQCALTEIKKIHAAGRIPFLVGGTMMYFNVLLNGLADLPKANQVIRENIRKTAENKGWPHLHETLKKIDPDTAKRLHPNDGQRIARALEVYELSGKTLTDLHATTTHPLSFYQIINIAIAPSDRKILHERIEKRFLDMLKNGLIEEVVALRERGDLTLSLPAMRSVGYHEVWQYLDGTITFEEMQNRGIFATRQLAKRQITWLNRFPDAVLFDSEDPDLMEKVRGVIDG